MKLMESLLWEKDEGYRFSDLHLARMERSAALFGFPFSREDAYVFLRDCEKELNTLRGPDEQGMKLRIFLDSEGKLSWDHESLNTRAVAGALRVAVARDRINPSDRMFYHKTTKRAFYLNAMPEKNCVYDDLLFLNIHGELCESTRANIVLDTGSGLFTPPVSCGLLPGTFREHLLSCGEIHEKKLYKTDLHSAVCIFLINSVRGWMTAVLTEV